MRTLFFIYIFSCIAGFQLAAKSLAVPDSINEKSVFSDKAYSDIKSDKDPFVKNEPGFWDWLMRKLFGEENENADGVLWTVRILFILFFLFILVLILYKSGFRNPFRKKPLSTTNIYADIGSDIHDIDLDKLIENALKENNFRLAIRFEFLKVLKHLDAEGKIAWANYKTNRDFYNELQLAEDRRNYLELATLFEKFWYGEFIPDQNDHALADQTFRKFFMGKYA